MQSYQNYSEWIIEKQGIARNCYFACVWLLLVKTNPTLKKVKSIAEAYEATRNSINELKKKFTIHTFM